MARFPAPYNAISPITTTTKARSNNLKLEGSNLRVFWPGYSLIDWSPKSIPRKYFEASANFTKPYEILYILRGDEMISIYEGKTNTWHRLK